MSDHGIGEPVARREDPALLTGEARFTDDTVPSDAVFVAAHRSRFPHAKIEEIDTSDAEAIDGIVGVHTAADLRSADVPGDYPVRGIPDDLDLEPPDRPLLTDGTARYQGEPIALVVAEERYVASQAAAEIDVEYDRLESVVDPTDANDEDVRIHGDHPENLAFEWEVGDADATDEAFGNADHTVSLDLANQRLVPVPIEPRAMVATHRDDELTVRMSTQTPHHHRTFLSAALGLPESSIRVVAPAVGGGFGSKDHFHSIEALACWCATRLDRPVAWQATRGETFQTDAHGRGHQTSAELALDGDGRIRGLRATTSVDLGAYVSTSAAHVTTHSYGRMLSGAYEIPAIHCTVDGYFTNAAPTGAYRGAGRPEAAYVVERLVSVAAEAVGVDPVDLRRRNLIDPDEFPYETSVGYVYDSGEYEQTLDLALDLVDYEQQRARQGDLREAGRYLGIGVSTFVEVAGYGPIRGDPGGDIPPLYEGGRVRFHPSGQVTAYCGTADQGQGHETTYVQVLADELGVDPGDIHIEEGDTEDIAYGTGTFGSRSSSVGTGVLVESARRVVDKARGIAAEALEARESDIEFDDGDFKVRGAPDRAIDIQTVAKRAYFGRDLPTGEDPGLEASAVFAPEGFNFPFGTHVCVLEIDPESGQIEIDRYVAVDDCGTQLNPMIVEGQIHGGVAQGLGQALYEEAIYEDGGNLATGSLQDYAVPKADHVPRIETDYTETPSPHNPTGAKGVGESGTIAAPPAIVNAVVDALRRSGEPVDHVDMPLTAERVWRAANGHPTPDR